FFTSPSPPDTYPLSLHDALPICHPIAREFLHRRELHALRRIRHRLLVGPLRRRDASAEVGEGLVRSVKLEGADGVRCGRLRGLRSEEHTSELQSRSDLVCRLLLE